MNPILCRQTKILLKKRKNIYKRRDQTKTLKEKENENENIKETTA